jgi:hypothetical protein
MFLKSIATSTKSTTSTQLPVGAESVLETVPTPTTKHTLTDILTDFKEVFPEKLPSGLPPNRKLGDEHEINLVEDAKIPPRKLYKVSP